MDKVVVNIGKKTYNCQVARTEEEKRKGLMGVENLPPDEGMLFVWEDEGTREMWMKNTLIPLGMARHDLIAALIKSEFNYYPLSCGKIRLVQDTEDATDTDYATRMLIFECYTDANLTKNINGQQQMINKVWS